MAISHDDAAGPVLVLDAGTGLRQVTPLLGGGPFTGTILLTHLHWDHVHGLPFFRGGDRDGAVAELLELVRRDRKWNEEAARKQLVTLFEAMGPADPRTIEARRKLSGLLFS